ncbi:hypothetical protein BsWGS_03033 [Bradybaena similaris]
MSAIVLLNHQINDNLNLEKTTSSVSGHHQPVGVTVTERRKAEQLNEDSLSQFLTSVQHLLLKYRMYSKSAAPQVASGGLQQFISRKMRDKRDDSDDKDEYSLAQRMNVMYSKTESVVLNMHDDQEEQSFFRHLPIDLKLHIFSYLDARSLCVACCVNQEWSRLTSDELLWQSLLKNDMQKWSQISHVTNPRMYLEINSEWSCKEIYLRCSPDFSRHLRQVHSTFHHVSSLLKYLLPKKIPKVAMFGPGLEQSTSGIVRRILYEENQIFTRVAMFPGQFDGVGGGITLKLQSGHSLHLSVLYSASKQERENRGAHERLKENKMFQQRQGEDAGADGAEPLYELKPQIKHLCHVLDGLIFVVDASESKQSVAKCGGELMAMVRERRSAPHVPVLILSCIEEADGPRLPAYDVVDLLNLSSISQPWLVIDCVSSSLQSVDAGVTWLVEQAQFR